MHRCMEETLLPGKKNLINDVYYVDHITLLGDWKIIFQTVKTVLKREGISSGSSETMEIFTGTPEK